MPASALILIVPPDIDVKDARNPPTLKAAVDAARANSLNKRDLIVPITYTHTFSGLILSLDWAGACLLRINESLLPTVPLHTTQGLRE